MARNHYFEILGALSKAGLNQSADITDLVHELFPLEKNYYSETRVDAIKRFMFTMHFNEHLLYMPIGEGMTDQWTSLPNTTEYKIIAIITLAGYNLFKEESSRLLNEELSKSILETNKSVKSNNKNTYRILALTAMVTVINLGITAVNFIKDTDKAQLRISLQQQNKKLKELQSMIDQRDLILFRLITEKKILPTTGQILNSKLSPLKK